MSKDCEYCKGAGSVPCNHCGGFDNDCPRCLGSGVESCEYCEGTGKEK